MIYIFCVLFFTAFVNTEMIDMIDMINPKIHEKAVYSENINIEIQFTFKNSSKDDYIYIRDSKIDHGKWTTSSSKCKESSQSPDNTIITDKPTSIYSCGRQMTATGIEGSMHLANKNDESIYNVHFNMPYVGQNYFDLDPLVEEKEIICTSNTQLYKPLSDHMDAYVKCFNVA